MKGKWPFVPFPIKNRKLAISPKWWTFGQFLSETLFAQNLSLFSLVTSVRPNSPPVLRYAHFSPKTPVFSLKSAQLIAPPAGPSGGPRRGPTSKMLKNVFFSVFRPFWVILDKINFFAPEAQKWLSPPPAGPSGGSRWGPTSKMLKNMFFSVFRPFWVILEKKIFFVPEAQKWLSPLGIPYGARVRARKTKNARYLQNGGELGQTETTDEKRD